jgi:hypothetical protein
MRGAYRCNHGTQNTLLIEADQKQLSSGLSRGQAHEGQSCECNFMHVYLFLKTSVEARVWIESSVALVAFSNWQTGKLAGGERIFLNRIEEAVSTPAWNHWRRPSFLYACKLNLLIIHTRFDMKGTVGQARQGRTPLKRYYFRCLLAIPRLLYEVELWIQNLIILHLLCLLSQEKRSRYLCTTLHHELSQIGVCDS